MDNKIGVHDGHLLGGWGWLSRGNMQLARGNGLLTVGFGKNVKRANYGANEQGAAIFGQSEGNFVGHLLIS